MTAAARSDAPWLSVVGIGDDGLASLSAAARAALEAGEVLVGGERHLEMVRGHPAQKLPWRHPLEATLDDLEAWRGRPVVVLASGDPMCFGIGELLLRRFPRGELRILPAPSVIALVCARLGWPWIEIEAVSLHARPLGLLHRHLAPGARLVVLSEDGQTPDQVAALLAGRGFGPSRIWVFEHLGGPGERVTETTVSGWRPAAFQALNTLAIACAAGPGASVQASVPGLPDDAFRSDGMLTKREVRAATLARLMPLPGQRLWDVGAGSGAIAIEWLRSARRGCAVAIERDAGRCASIRENALALGTPELEVRHASAPACLGELAAPDAVFVGGGITAPGLLETCWQALRQGGRLVANVVTLEGERALLDWQARHGGELVRIAVARVEPVGGYQGWRPALPVTQLAAHKPLIDHQPLIDPPTMITGRLLGIGVGPGDPELLTLKAVRYLRTSPVVAYVSASGRPSLARQIAAVHLPGGQRELNLALPMQPLPELAQAAYDEGASRIGAELEQGRDVALLCEGDPLFYGSFSQLLVRLMPYPAEIVPGVTSFAAAAAAARQPLVARAESFIVVPATAPLDQLRARLAQSEAAAILKLGRHVDKVRRLLDELGLLERAIYVERASTERERVLRLTDFTDDEAPYFALILLPGGTAA